MTGIDAMEQPSVPQALSPGDQLPMSRSSSPLRMPDFMHIDRPSDDELGQQYIRSGGQMTAYLEGVGDLCSFHGPKLVLEEGCKLIKNQHPAWRGETYVRRLKSLADSM
jgi:hypothetical protein